MGIIIIHSCVSVMQSSFFTADICHSSYQATDFPIVGGSVMHYHSLHFVHSMYSISGILHKQNTGTGSVLFEFTLLTVPRRFFFTGNISIFHKHLSSFKALPQSMASMAQMSSHLLLIKKKLSWVCTMNQSCSKSNGKYIAHSHIFHFAFGHP